jgi:hypothetical protein
MMLRMIATYHDVSSVMIHVVCDSLSNSMSNSVTIMVVATHNAPIALQIDNLFDIHTH